MSKKLHIEIRKLIDAKGAEIVKTILLSNILADTFEYEEYPTAKIVLRDILSQNYGEKLYRISINNDNKEERIEKVYNTFIAEHRYKKDIVRYVFDCITYGLNLSEEVRKPITTGYDPYSKPTDSILDELTGLLSKFKKEYTEKLESLIVKPKDIIHDSSAYYPAIAENELYLIENKIEIIKKELRITDNWCQSLKKTTLKRYSDQKTNAVKEFLDSKKTEFLKILDEEMIIPKKSYISRSAYYSHDSINKLNEIEIVIKKLYFEANIKYDGWCQNVLDKQLEPYLVPRNNLIKQLIWKITVPCLAFIFLLFGGINYGSSVDEINKFENRIASANLLLDRGEYDKASLAFEEAGIGYSGSFRPNHYTSIAEDGINKCYEKIKEDVNLFLEKRDYASALKLIQLIPDDIATSREEIMQYKKNAISTIKSSIDYEIETFANNISRNNGKMTDADKKVLDNILIAVPDHYWANIIKNKEK